MKNLVKYLAVAGAVVAFAGSAFAIPTLTISDGVTSVTVTDASGIVAYNNASFDGNWSVVISTGETKPAFGTASKPFMDLNIQATSLGSTHNLVVTFSDTSYGPTSGGFQAQLSGHVTAPAGGPGGSVNYNTFYSAANTIPAATALTASGTISDASGVYSSIQIGSLNQSLYSLSQIVTIGASPAASYSLDASLVGVPDGGTTVALLGFALVGVATLRRKFSK